MTSGKFATTLGYERRYNPAMQFNSRDAFVEYMNQGQPSRPANFVNIVAINQGKKPLTVDEPGAPALSATEAARLIEQGCLVIDTRSEGTFGGGHIPGSYNIQLSSVEFEQRVGWVTPPEAELLLLLEDEADLRRTLKAMAFLGLDQRVKGYISGGIRAWLNNGLPVKTLPQITVQQLRYELQNGSEMNVLDVRDVSEWDAGHIEVAHHMNYKHLRQQLNRLALKPDDPISVLCAAGMRSSTACSILLMNGYRHIHNVTGGMNAWASAGLPMVDGAGQPLNKT